MNTQLFLFILMPIMAWFPLLASQENTPENTSKKPQEKAMVIVITSYNNKEWYQRNLDSAFNQKYGNYRILFVDDASPDGTGTLVKDYIQAKGQEKLVELRLNPVRVGALANLYSAIHSCKKNEIVVSLDGDDWLAHENVLSYLNNVYADPNVWLTYGQFVIYPNNAPGFASAVPEKVVHERSFRDNPGGITHLRTFYAGLFQEIKKEDLLYEGNFYPMAWDVAMLMPMCEMAGNRIKFIPDVLYVYNLSNPINDEKVNRALQMKLDSMIRKKEKYAFLDSPPF